MTPEWIVFIKPLHLTTVTLSFTGFLLRAWWRGFAPERLERPWVRRLPHVNDTVLLASGLTLAAILQVSPLEQTWLAAKLGALIVYIVFGSLALRRGRTRTVRLAALAAACAAFAYIVAAALTKQGVPWV